MPKIESLEEYEEQQAKEIKKREITPKQRIISILIVAIISISLGIMTYAICSIIIEKKDNEKKDAFFGEKINLNDENVQILYEYVTYGIDGTRNTKFVEERYVDMASFNDEEKLYYAFQFVQPEDFEFTGEYDSQKHKIYTLSKNIIEKYLKLYFGPNITYQPVNKITYPFLFTINKMNVGTMVYNNERGGYDTIFASYKNTEENKNIIDPVYGQLSSAIRKADGSIVIQERVLYTDLKVDSNGYTINIYKEPEKQTLLKTIENLTEEEVKQFSINFTNYPSTTIIEYTFGVNGTICYFASSRIIS